MTTLGCEHSIEVFVCRILAGLMALAAVGIAVLGFTYAGPNLCSSRWWAIVLYRWRLRPLTVCPQWEAMSDEAAK